MNSEVRNGAGDKGTSPRVFGRDLSETVCREEGLSKTVGRDVFGNGLGVDRASIPFEERSASRRIED